MYQYNYISGSMSFSLPENSPNFSIDSPILPNIRGYKFDAHFCGRFFITQQSFEGNRSFYTSFVIVQKNRIILINSFTKFLVRWNWVVPMEALIAGLNWEHWGQVTRVWGHQKVSWAEEGSAQTSMTKIANRKNPDQGNLFTCFIFFITNE